MARRNQRRYTPMRLFVSNYNMSKLDGLPYTYLNNLYKRAGRTFFSNYNFERKRYV
jgi:hypothetical protein